MILPVLLAALVATEPALPTAVESQACSVDSDPRPLRQLSLQWMEGTSKGLWLSETKAVELSQRVYVAEEAAAKARIPWWVWAGAGVVVGVVGASAVNRVTK